MIRRAISRQSRNSCRRWGIADAVHACPFAPDYPLDVAFVTSLSGHELGRMPRPPRMSEQPEPHSPMRLQACSQMSFDPILQRFARGFPHVGLRYRIRLESFEAGDRGVTADPTGTWPGARTECRGTRAMSSITCGAHTYLNCASGSSTASGGPAGPHVMLPRQQPLKS